MKEQDHVDANVDSRGEWAYPRRSSSRPVDGPTTSA
jgi:hypothetical protein